METKDSSEVHVIELARVGGVADDMTPEMVPLEDIEPNPWQGRLAEDPAHVRNLAEDIAANTLLQPGLGRRVGGRVQLAFAHSRWAAFKFLDEAFGVEGGNGQAGDRFARFPVIIRELTDRQMSDYAAAENARRKDLSAIETATAIQKRMADFGLTQLEAGRPFGYTNQGSVAHLLRLLELPEEMRDLVNRRQLPERYARALLPLSKILPEAVSKLAQKIAQAPPSQRDKIFEDDVADLLDEHGQDMNEDPLWPFDWSEPEVPACNGCDYFIQFAFEDQCANPTCYRAKFARWTELELTRLSEKLGLPIAADATIKPLKIEWQNDDKAKAYLKRKNKPDLYLLPSPPDDNGTGKWSYHHRLLGSNFVVMGSTDARLFNMPAEKAVESGKTASTTSGQATSGAAATPSAPQESEAAKAKRLEREEQEAEERREARSALRRARYDLVWLIMHTAEVLAPSLQISGGILVKCTEWALRFTQKPQYEWTEYDTAYKPFDKFHTAHGIRKVGTTEEELRRLILVRLMASEISGYKAEQQFNWTRGCEEVQEVVEGLRLQLPKGWDQPPIHTTETNCHVCGQFTPGNTITGRDVEHGWKSEGGVVTCSDECQGKLGQPAAKKATKKAPVKKAQSKRGKR